MRAVGSPAAFRRRMRALLVLTVCAACADNSDSSEGYCPTWLPAPYSGPRLTVTEGGATGFMLSTSPFNSSETVSVMIATADPAIATMTPRGFGIGSADPTSPLLEIYGVADGLATGDRRTAIVAVFDDCGGGDPGAWANVVVVDRDSPNVIASEWNLYGSMNAFDVGLTQPPPSPVTVTVMASSGLAVTPSSLVFDATTYGVAQNVTVTGSANSGQIALVPDGGLPSRTVLVSW
jgi:hypothetical protein